MSQSKSDGEAQTDESVLLPMSRTQSLPVSLLYLKKGPTRTGPMSARSLSSHPHHGSELWLTCLGNGEVLVLM